MKLSDLACRNAKPRDKAYKLFDGGGLYLEVMPSGHRHWRLKYRIHGKEKRLSIGAYPLHSLSEAREERDKAKKGIEANIDPSEEKQRKKHLAALEAAQTFELVAREWHKRHYTTWSKGHADAIIYRLETDLFPSIGHYAMSKITAPIILSCLQKIEDRGAQEVARRSLSMCGQICRYGVVTGRAERDVTRDLKGALKRQIRRHFASIESDELPDLLKKLKQNDGRLYKQTLHLIRLMMLTFVRTGELIGAKWSEINLDKAEWIIPEERMKMRKQHIVPLSAQALVILKELQGTNGHRVYVFPSLHKPNQSMSNGTILMALKRMGYNKQMTGHGFRALAMSTIKEKLEYNHEVVDRQLAHAPRNSVDKAYDRAKFLPQRRKMMQDWADYIDSLI